MPIPNNVATASIDAANDLVDADSNPGYLEARDGTDVLVTITLQAEAFAGAVNGVASANGLPLFGTATDSGDADNWVLRDGAGNLCRGPETVSPTIPITSGDIVVLTSLTTTQPTE